MSGARLEPHPHGSMPAHAGGMPLEEAAAAMILIHGRGASARSMLTLESELESRGLALIAPQAAGFSWYPQSFLAPIEANEPHLSSALRRIHELVEGLATRGIPPHHVLLLGFSQGACLGSEYVARHPRRYGGVAALSGGLIGPPGIRWAQSGSLDETPIFVGCSDQDAHIPLERVQETSQHLRALGAQVDERIYPGMGHTINRDELDAVQGLIDRVRAAAGAG